MMDSILLRDVLYEGFLRLSVTMQSFVFQGKVVGKGLEHCCSNVIGT